LTDFLKEVTELFWRNFIGVQDLLQRAGLDEVLARNDDKTFVIGHGNVLAFSKEVKA